MSESTLARARAKRNPTGFQVPAPPPGHGRAIKTGAQATGQNLPEFPATLAEIQQIVADECSWVKASDMPLVSVFAAELTVFHRAASVLATQTPRALLKAKKAQQVQVRRARALAEIAAQLGMSPSGRFRLGLTQAKTERAMQHVEPHSSEDHAKAVAELLAKQHALPAVEVDPTDAETTPPTQPEQPIEEPAQ